MVNKKVVVAFSGGKDSLALLKYMHDHKDYGGWAITACHINHQLRGGESVRDMRFCEEWCFLRGIDFICVTVDVLSSDDSASRGVEHAARMLRYESLQKVLKSKEADYILTAHTYDDQLESFFVDLCTGASIYTLGGIKKTQDNICRPFLDVSTAMVNEYLECEAVMPVYDSSNSSKNYVRNSVRMDVMPVLLNAHPAAAQTILKIQEQSGELYRWFDSLVDGAAVNFEREVVIDRGRFGTFALPLKKFLLGKWISTLCRGGDVHVDAVLKLLESGKSVRINLPEKYCCEVNPKNIRIFPSSSICSVDLIKPAGVSKMVVEGKTVIFSGDYLDKIVRVRTRKNGDKYRGIPLKKLFYSGGVELFDRDRMLVFEIEEEVVWVEGVSRAQNNSIKIY